MKASQRHHLKENELASTVVRAREVIDRNQRTIIGVIALAVLLVVVAGGYRFYRERTNSQAAEMLSGAMTILEAPVVPPADAAPATSGTPPPAPPPGSYPSERAKLEAALPKLVAVMDSSPSTPAGIAARYHVAATLALLGRGAEAEQRYKEVIDRDPQGIYGEMARLGLAEVLARAGKFDAAIETWKPLTTSTQGAVPVDGALMQLGRTYVMAGRPADAVLAFNRVVEEFPESVYAQTARQELDALKGMSGTAGTSGAPTRN
jgi:TolA-binding protein